MCGLDGHYGLIKDNNTRRVTSCTYKASFFKNSDVMKPSLFLRQGAAHAGGDRMSTGWEPNTRTLCQFRASSCLRFSSVSVHVVPVDVCRTWRKNNECTPASPIHRSVKC